MLLHQWLLLSVITFLNSTRQLCNYEVVPSPYHYAITSTSKWLLHPATQPAYCLPSSSLLVFSSVAQKWMGIPFIVGTNKTGPTVVTTTKTETKVLRLHDSHIRIYLLPCLMDSIHVPLTLKSLLVLKWIMKDGSRKTRIILSMRTSSFAGIWAGLKSCD